MELALTAEQKEEYRDCKIVDIHYGKGERKHIIYARVVNAKGETMISATFDYIFKELPYRLPKK